MSLPLWECGLKYCKEGADVSSLESLPLWECGLKLTSTWLVLYWINVTPLVGVWIEIVNIASCFFCTPSLPLWECGLK